MGKASSDMRHAIQETEDRPEQIGRWRYAQGLDEGHDALHSARVYPSGNKFGIPDLPHVPLSKVPEQLVPYRTRLRDRRSPKGIAVHYYLDDYRFQVTWSRPIVTSQALDATFEATLTPDFSLYIDMPQIMQIWNIYRNRWIGRYWSEQTNMTVIPSVSWSTVESHAYAFLGLPERSVLCCSGAQNGGRPRDPEHLRCYLEGYREMVRVTKPTLVMVYGNLPEALRDLAPYREYPTRWQQIRAENMERTGMKPGRKSKAAPQTTGD